MQPSLLRPSPGVCAKFLAEASTRCFSPAVEALSRGERPTGFVEDRNRRRIGSGEEDFARARAAITDWQMFGMSWLSVVPEKPAIVEQATVCILAKAFGVWTLSPARIYSRIETTGVVDRFGFAYGTLPGHAEEGIESFSVEWNRADDSVWYDLHAFSRPARWFTKLMAGPTRRVQRRFARESMAAMERAG